MQYRVTDGLSTDQTADLLRTLGASVVVLEPLLIRVDWPADVQVLADTALDEVTHGTPVPSMGQTFDELVVDLQTRPCFIKPAFGSPRTMTLRELADAELPGASLSFKIGYAWVWWRHGSHTHELTFFEKLVWVLSEHGRLPASSVVVGDWLTLMKDRLTQDHDEFFDSGGLEL